MQPYFRTKKQQTVHVLLNVQALDFTGFQISEGGPIVRFWTAGVSIARFRARGIQNVAKGSILENAEDFSQIWYQKCTKIALQAISDIFLCPGVQNVSSSDGRSKSIFLRLRSF